MIPFRTQVKFLLDIDKASDVDLADFVGVFQRWIQQNALDELLIDVADYKHVFEGPGIVLIGHFSDYSIESREGHVGLLYTRKRQVEGELQSQLRTAIRFALKAAALLEAEADFDPRLKFRADAFEIRFADRLQLPNQPESFAAILGDLQVVLSELYGGNKVAFAPRASDPRHLLTVDVQGEGATAITDLLQQFQASVES
ncbi:MAG: hypothetical protein ABI690_15830 [Chloroflexota bacterium]